MTPTPPTLPMLPTPAASAASAASAAAVLSPLAYPGVTFGAVGLELPDDLDYDDWLAITLHIYHRADAYRWAIGDALNFGERVYGAMYSQAEDDTKMDYWRLTKYKWVSSRVPHWIRNQNLSWSHHCVVAPLPEQKQRDWLDRAEREGMAVAVLRDCVKDELPPKAKQPESKQMAPDSVKSAPIPASMAPTPPEPTDPETDPLTAEEEAERLPDAWEPLPRTCPHCGGAL